MALGQAPCSILLPPLPSPCEAASRGGPFSQAQGREGPCPWSQRVEGVGLDDLV